jgi:hypothetical protein
MDGLHGRRGSGAAAELSARSALYRARGAGRGSTPTQRSHRSMRKWDLIPPRSRGSLIAGNGELWRVPGAFYGLGHGERDRVSHMASPGTAQGSKGVSER